MPKIVALCMLLLVASLAVLWVVETAAGLSSRIRIAVTLVSTVSYGLLLLLRPEPALVAGWIGLVAVALIGHGFGSRFIPNAPGLIAFLLTASVMDVSSVASGPTRALLESAADGTNSLVFYLTLLLPWDGRLLPAVGVGDLLGLAVLFASLRQQGFSSAKAFVVGFLGLFSALVVALIRGGVAGYPFLALAVIGSLAIEKRRRK